MRTADYEAELSSVIRQRDLSIADSLMLREEKMFLSESLDRSKDAIAAVIEQREKLAAKLREAKR